MDMVDGWVGDSGIQEGVELSDHIRESIEKEYLPGSGYSTAEELVWKNGVICHCCHNKEFETPFTVVYSSKKSGRMVMRKTKTCGYAHGKDYDSYTMDVVREQLDQRLADAQNVYGKLTKMDLSSVQPEEDSSPIDLGLFAEMGGGGIVVIRSDGHSFSI